VRTTLDPATGAVVGQPVRLLVDVLFRGAMPRPPRVRIGDVPGAQILRFETQAVTTTDRIDGEAYAGQRFEFVVFPRRGGALEIPGAEVTLLDAAGDPAGVASGEKAQLAVTVPPGIDASGPVLAANTVRAAQTWQPDPAAASLEPGGALTRTIRREAAGVPALGMADFAFTAPDGVRVYVDPPQAEDRVNRGEVHSVRNDRVTYVFEKEGRYDLPALTQPWWDLDDRTARAETLPGARVTIAHAAPSAARQAADPARRWVRIGAAALAAAAVVLLLRALVPKLLALARERRRRFAESEASARAVLRRTAVGGDAAATYRALVAWLERLPPESCRAVRNDAQLGPLADRLERSLFRGDTAWSPQHGADLAREVGRLRPRLASAATAGATALPPLNPA